MKYLLLVLLYVFPFKNRDFIKKNTFTCLW